MAKLNKDKYLVFIDTCVFLGFYRTQKAHSLLSHLSAIADRIITTEQVEMEYKKNRQKVISDSEKSLVPPQPISPPLFLTDAKDIKGINRDINDCIKRIKRVKARLRNIIQHPQTHDKVYTAAQKIFNADNGFNLSRDKKERFEIRRLARKRFQLGYPPRKDKDSSYGDAINWEWIIKCSQESGNHIIVVSHDSDYGIISEISYPNDWLLEEFKDRTSRKRQLVLTPYLSEALAKLSVKVSRKEQAEEREAVAESAREDAKVIDMLEATPHTKEEIVRQLHERSNRWALSQSRLREFQDRLNEFKKTQVTLAEFQKIHQKLAELNAIKEQREDAQKRLAELESARARMAEMEEIRDRLSSPTPPVVLPPVATDGEVASE
ncbi:MAG: PIN domain-containing protein [Phycisphaerae bacterium]|jgi:hypothetical protein